MKNTILLAGDDQPLWRELKEYCGRAESAWAPTFAKTEAEATHAATSGEYGAVVADVELAGGNGVDFLDLMMHRQPQAVRIVISDVNDSQNTLKCIGKGHYHLLKPCGVKELLEAIEQTAAPGTWQPSAAAQALIARMRRIPSPPTTYFQILTEMRSPNAWLERIGDLIAQDPAITAKVLQLANSAVFGLRLEVSHPRDAVIYIGLEATKALVLLAHTFSAFDRIPVAGFSVEALWRHSVVCGRLARRLATLECEDQRLAEEAFGAGLLHDIGKLLFAANLPDLFRQALSRAESQHRKLWEVEQEVFGVTHAEMGACLLGIWGLPASLVEAVALHHRPVAPAGGGFCTLTAVHAGNVLAHEAWPGKSASAREEFNMGYLAALKLGDRLDQWRQNCLEGEASGAAD